MEVDFKKDAFEDRADLLGIVRAAADYLRSLDREPERGARATWRLWKGPQGQPLIGLHLRDGAYSSDRTFTPNQLDSADIREYRLWDVWDGVLKYRLDDQIRRTNLLISQAEDQ